MGFFSEYKQAEEQRLLKEEMERRLKEAETFVNVAGGPVWVALDVDLEYRCALFISRDIIAQMPYNERSGSINWDKCSLRQWLNGSFFGSLPAHIRCRVVEVTNENPGYGKPTQDRVFLLSSGEVKKYFQSDYDRIAKFNGSADWWWLRSPGGGQDYAAYVGHYGDVRDVGNNVSIDGGGVRPALVLNLDA